MSLAIAEPNTGDFLVKLRPHRERSTEEVKNGLRETIYGAEPALHTEFPGVLSDLIGYADLLAAAGATPLLGALPTAE